jgi:hypothetical protein
MADQNRNQSNEARGRQEQPSSRRNTDDTRQMQSDHDDQSTGMGGSSRERTSREPASRADDRSQRDRRDMSGDESDSRLTRDSDIETENIESDLDSDIGEESER